MQKREKTFSIAEQQKSWLLIKLNPFRNWIPIAIFIGLLLPQNAFAGGLGIGYSSGQTFISYNVSSRIRAFIPLTFKDLAIDYRLISKGFGRVGGMGLKGYFGVGTQMSLDGGGNKKAKDGDILGGLGMSLRVSLGIETGLSRVPLTIFVEMNPNVDVENMGDIEWKKFNLGFIYLSVCQVQPF